MLSDIYVEYPDEMDGTEVFGDNLGMDSQEMVELKDYIERNYGINVDSQISFNSTVSELNEKIEAEISQIFNREDNYFEVLSKCSVYVPTSLDKIFDLIWDFKKWTTYLPNVTAIVANDQREELQDFYMTIKDGITVHSLRRRIEKYQIDFYQPTPPDHLLVHAGRWLFTEQSDGTTLVELSHKSIPDYEKCSKKYEETDHDVINQKVKEWLEQHGQTTLNTWKELLEKEQDKQKGE